MSRLYFLYRPQADAKSGSKTIASWNLPEPKNISVRLTDGDYLCPRCGQFPFAFQTNRILGLNGFLEDLCLT